ncbi:hypothetical protein F0U60_34505 [Archangium minus]|uniref:Lipoprotein n=1 Tax=Archangium minus TaxID=83450 RepID=A0ABY9WZU8_9BACT|nr:hypothetical protein F0U60_34505 [Archangium minus]
MSQRLLPSLLSLFLCTSAAQAAPPKKQKKSADTAKRVTLVIWGGGKTPADAERAMKDFTDRGFKSSASLVRLFSSEVRGLNPGFHIAVLGACSSVEGHALLRRARQFYPGVYGRAVPAEGEVAKLSCPSVTTPRREWYYEPSPDEPAVITSSEEVVVPAGTLKVTVEATIDSNSEFVAASYSVKTRLTKGEQVIDEWTHVQPDFATVSDLTLDGKTVVLTTKDALSDCKGDSFAEVEFRTRRFSVKNGKIAVKEQTTGRESSLCGPNYEGSTPCSIARQTALYNAVRGACENATRDDCMKAISEYEAEAEDVECNESYGGAD